MAGMQPPPLAVYATFDELLVGANNFATANGYKLVVVRSKTNTAREKTWVHLACDRHGTKRNTHGLTPETRKKNRRSRRCECPMYCEAKRTPQDMWQLTTKNGEHNHAPYEPPAPKKKADLPKPNASEVVNLPALQTPQACIADFCLVPIGTGHASVSAEIAEIQRLLRRTNMKHHMHSAGTTIEGSWDDVTRFIGQAHSLTHGSGVVRIQTHISISTRTDKKQGFQDKVDAVHAILDGVELPDHEDDDNMLDETEGPSMHDIDSSLVENNNPNIQPGLDQHRLLPHFHSTPMANMGQNMSHSMQQQLLAATGGHPMHSQQSHHQMSPSTHMRQGQGQASGHQHSMNQSLNMQ